MAEPQKDKKPKIRWSTAWSEARDLMWARRGRLALGFLLVLINTGASFVLPWSTKYFIDTVIGQQRMDLLTNLALAVGAATIVQACTSFALSQVLGIAAQRAITEMRRRVEEHILRLPVRFFDTTQTGVLISRIMTDADGIRNLVGSGIVQLVGGVLGAAVAMTVLVYINWKLTALVLVALACFGGVMAYAFRTLRPLFRARGKLHAEVTGRLTQALSGVRVVKTYTAEKREDLIFTEGVHKLLRNVAKTMTGTSGMSAFAALVIGVVGVITFVIGGRSIVAGEMSLGDLFRYVTFTAYLTMPVFQLASIGTQVTEAFAGLDRIREIMDTAREDADPSRTNAVEALRGQVEFDHVWFEYNAGMPVLKDVSFVAPAGSTTALVGSSGSGKSTIISLIMAFNRPLNGRVLIDGVDLTTLRLAEYRRHLGVVMQDNFLFDGTVAENIAYGIPNATREDIEQVARVAHADEFVSGFEKGYDTIVGERGVRLSGGQRQRVAIARAILANPRVLLLDEATSSLDSESEALIQDGLRALRRGRTTFVIAHRLSTIQSADQILVVEAGEIVERGTHETLLAGAGRYRQLYDKQYRFERDRFINPGEELQEETSNFELRTSK
jgi:ABC-type multidrug transport system fused ATPase/permease subunit